MKKELNRQQRADAVASIRQYAERQFPEPLGELDAGLLLDFFLEEIGPVVYNQGVADAQARTQTLVAELDGELYQAPFTYWQQKPKARSR